jgi:hypothetical protein
MHGHAPTAFGATRQFGSAAGVANIWQELRQGLPRADNTGPSERRAPRIAHEAHSTVRSEPTALADEAHNTGPSEPTAPARPSRGSPPAPDQADGTTAAVKAVKAVKAL